MSKYSSYKEHQLLTENWREFLKEERPDDNEVAKLASLVVSGADGGASSSRTASESGHRKRSRPSVYC